MTSKPRYPTIAMMMLPRDTNGMGNIFGGVILSHIDIAGGIAARNACAGHVHRCVTVAMKEVVFKKPVHVGDTLICYAEVTAIGRTSIHIHVDVEVERQGKAIPVTEAEVVYVAIDENDRPTPVLCAQVKHRCKNRKRDAKKRQG